MALQTRIDPLLVCVPSPAEKVNSPPLVMVLRPDDRRIKPPEPLFPLPTLILSTPAHPDDEAPEPSEIMPLFPESADPELNTRRPPAPPIPLFAV